MKFVSHLIALPDVVAFRSHALEGPWSAAFLIAPYGTRTYNSQSGFTLAINGTKQTTYLYIGDQVQQALQGSHCSYLSW
jgi:hypothetical protein